MKHFRFTDAESMRDALKEAREEIGSISGKIPAVSESFSLEETAKELFGDEGKT